MEIAIRVYFGHLLLKKLLSLHYQRRGIRANSDQHFVRPFMYQRLSHRSLEDRKWMPRCFLKWFCPTCIAIKRFTESNIWRICIYLRIHFTRSDRFLAGLTFISSHCVYVCFFFYVRSVEISDRLSKIFFTADRISLSRHEYINGFKEELRYTKVQEISKAIEREGFPLITGYTTANDM